MAGDNQWLDWLKCNVLEIIILILVLAVLVKVYSVPTVENFPAITGTTVLEEPLPQETAPVVPVEGAPAEETLVEEAKVTEEQPSEREAIPEPAADAEG